MLWKTQSDNKLKNKGHDENRGPCYYPMVLSDLSMLVSDLSMIVIQFVNGSN